MADKGRAVIAGTAGDFHFDCPLDNYLFGLKGVKGADVKPLLETGANNEVIAVWLDALATPKPKHKSRLGLTPWKPLAPNSTVLQINLAFFCIDRSDVMA